ncbi:MAG: phosphocholine cytidylyltransferase family protein [Candidatus Dadabacteria bacterium]|nr:phosphocholine cytidylyltransferase family protein [Candidatus Dadabacteria bacterium]
MKAIILAAGNGKRLNPYTNEIPKCLLDLGGITILENQLNNIRKYGIDDVVIVIGYKSDKIEQFLRNYDELGILINTIYNPFYRETNSLVSLWTARGEMDQDLVVMNGDDVFEFDLLEKILDSKEHNICLPIKIKNKYEDEDMKINIHENLVSEIGKSLTWSISGEAVGIRVFRSMGVVLLKRALEEEIRTEGATEKWYVSAVQRLISKGYKVNAIDIEDLYWMDVDFPEDFIQARVNSNMFKKKLYQERKLRVVEAF